MDAVPAVRKRIARNIYQHRITALYMTENPGQYATDRDLTGEYFTVATPLHAVRPGYIRRAADRALYEAIVAGRFAHIIAPNRSGKSSLIAATSARLQNNGFKVAVLDLAQISERDGGTDAGRWYYSIAYRLLRQLRLKIDLQDWWQDKSILSNRQRLVEFYIEVILQHIPEPVVIFVDEVQCIEDRPFSEHVLASIRAAWNARITEPDFQRLTFVLSGECDPVTLMPDPEESPFAISQEIRLQDFTRDDLDVFATELNLSPSDATLALDRVYYCTGGHPYLSQKLARAIAREQISGNIKEHVDRIAVQQLARAALHSEPHMSHIHRRIVNDRKNAEPLLNLYGRLRKGIEIEFDPESRHQRMLMAIGLVVQDEHGRLKVRNRLYRAVFTSRWANENLPLHWRGPAIAALVLLIVTAVPFWYTQMLPKPYMDVLSSPALPLESVYESYVNLGSFPGHADSAERLFRNHLELRASQAQDLDAMREIDGFARRLPDSAVFADAMLADFWDGQVGKALQMEQRDEALLAAIQSLVVATPTRRRRAARLIGDDYQHLIGTIPVQQSEAVLFDPDNLLVSFASGAEVDQWSMINGLLREREPWTISALEVTPLVRRATVEQSGQVRDIGLEIAVSHARLDDIRLKLIAPSGRTAELTFPRAEAVAAEPVGFAGGALRVMRGEPVSGTWTLSIRDEAAGVTGQLHGWTLRLNERQVVEDLERGLNLPDPEARPSDDIWFAPDGRHAIARAKQSDSARLWDLANAQPARAIAVPAGERVLGLSGNAAFLMTVAQNSVNLWRTDVGTRVSTLDLGDASSGIIRSSDGEHLLVSHHGDANTQFELWSLAENRIVARLDVAGSLALVALDANANHLAVADYDRAVRIWDLRDGGLLSQIDLRVQPTAISLSANGETLGVVHGNSGISLWRTDRPDEPLVVELGKGKGGDGWQLAFSPSGERVVAGNHRQGFQVYRSVDGALSGPALGSGLPHDSNRLLAFSNDEQLLVTADAAGKTRVWRVPATPVAIDPGSPANARTGHGLWRESGDLVSTLGPGGERLAIGDNAGHVHILHVDATAEELAEAGGELNFLGHRSPVAEIEFSPDGRLIASAGSAGTVRIWNTGSGLPRPFYAGISASSVDRLEFSPSSGRLAVLSGRRVWVMDVDTGEVLTDLELGEIHSSMAFADDGRLFLGAESGALRLLESDRTGSWNLRSVWAGSSALRRLELSSRKKLLVIVDALHKAQVLDFGNGRIGPSVLQLPGAVGDIAFSPNESRVLFRTGRWIHRASVSPSGLIWLDAMRTPKAMAGSRMVFDTAAPLPGGPVGVAASADSATAAGSDAARDPLGNRAMLLTRDAGFAEVAILDFSYESGPTLFGSREQLLEEWRRRLGVP
jgi:WD40 repeat protein